jgi:hemolysin activation/secretion protein
MRMDRQGRARSLGGAGALGIAMGGIGLIASPVPGATALWRSVAAQPSGPTFEVSAFRWRYAPEHPELPPLAAFDDLAVELGFADDVFMTPEEGGEVRSTAMGELMAEHPGRRYTAGAINAIGARLVRSLNDRGIVGVFVLPDGEQLSSTGEDLRPGAAGPLTLVISVSVIAEVRTTASGDRFAKDAVAGDAPGEDLVNRPEHARIRSLSPVRPANASGSAGQNLFRRDLLEDYLFRLNRRPGRRVSAAATATGTPGELQLEYDVAENKPWTIYGQAANTGTKQTRTWRERIGFVHNQLTDRDDTLSLEYVTAEFEAVNAVIGSYDTPLGDSMLWRGRLSGSWSEYTASELGFEDLPFKGRGYSLGGEVSREVFHDRELFIDAFAGAHFDHIHTDNQFALIEGEADFLLPNIGLRLERFTEKASTGASMTLETSLPGLTGVSDDDAVRLGRTDADAQWTVLRADASHSLYLEPLFMGKTFDDPATPDSRVTLAHELALSVRGQYAFGSRLIPQQVETAGGFYSVRGYQESILAGDDAIIGSIEYRFHLPRALGIEPDPSRTPLFGRPFRLRRQQRGGRPDWDLILKGFVDAARVVNNDRLSFESDDTLIGAGVGLEFQFKRHFNVRVDWGVAIEDAAGGAVTAGSDRFHISLTGFF